MTATGKKESPKTIAEHKRIFTELQDLCKQKAKGSEGASFPYGWTWWSLPPKMWRIAKALGFKNDEFNREWTLYNTISGYGDYTSSKVAQETALTELRKKYPESMLLKNISSCGRLD